MISPELALVSREFMACQRRIAARFAPLPERLISVGNDFQEFIAFLATRVALDNAAQFRSHVDDAYSHLREILQIEADLLLAFVRTFQTQWSHVPVYTVIHDYHAKYGAFVKAHDLLRQSISDNTLFDSETTRRLSGACHDFASVLIAATPDLHSLEASMRAAKRDGRWNRINIVVAILGVVAALIISLVVTDTRRDQIVKEAQNALRAADAKASRAAAQQPASGASAPK